jgi:hypothetical protein
MKLTLNTNVVEELSLYAAAAPVEKRCGSSSVGSSFSASIIRTEKVAKIVTIFKQFEFFHLYKNGYDTYNAMDN